MKHPVCAQWTKELTSIGIGIIKTNGIWRLWWIKTLLQTARYHIYAVHAIRTTIVLKSYLARVELRIFRT